jgi:hypothetical protein
MSEADQSWEIVDAIARSPLLRKAQIEPGIDLADVERALLATDRLTAHECELFLVAARELARAYGRLGDEGSDSGSTR